MSEGAFTPHASTLDYIVGATAGCLMGTLNRALQVRKIVTTDGRLESEAVGEIETRRRRAGNSPHSHPRASARGGIATRSGRDASSRFTRRTAPFTAPCTRQSTSPRSWISSQSRCGLRQRIAPSFTPASAFASLVIMAASAEHSSVRAGSRRVSESITSRDNRWLKQFRAALAGDAPRASSAGTGKGAADKLSGDIAGIEGARLVETALLSGTPIIAILTSDSGMQHLADLAAAIPAEARLLRTSDRLFAQIAATETPQGIAALVRPRAATFDDLVRGIPLVLLLAGVQDPGNVGVLIRTAEAFGVSGVAACSAGGIGTANPFGPKSLRASAGSALRVPTLRGVSAPVLMAQLRVAGVKIYAACPDDAATSAAGKALPPWEVDWRAPSALRVGNEGAGLPAELVRSADHIVRIPQAAASDEGEPMDSLNASVAGAVLLYEAARQRGLH